MATVEWYELGAHPSVARGLCLFFDRAPSYVSGAEKKNRQRAFQPNGAARAIREHDCLPLERRFVLFLK